MHSNACIKIVIAILILEDPVSFLQLFSEKECWILQKLTSQKFSLLITWVIDISSFWSRIISIYIDISRIISKVEYIGMFEPASTRHDGWCENASGDAFRVGRPFRKTKHVYRFVIKKHVYRFMIKKHVYCIPFCFMTKNHVYRFMIKKHAYHLMIKKHVYRCNNPGGKCTVLQH